LRITELKGKTEAELEENAEKGHKWLLD